MNENNKKAIIAGPLVVLREEFDDWAVLFDPETGNAFGLNPIGVLIWKHFDGRHSIDDIADVIRKRAEAIPDDMQDHLEDFVQATIDIGLAVYEAE